MIILNLLLKVLTTSFSMFWEVLWPLLLGFILSAIVQAFVPHKTLVKILGNDSLKSITLASLFGIASSSCSYAAVALARSLFQKGASFTAAMVFELASTNLVIELGIILVVLLGWQFMSAELIGGIIMITLVTIIFRLTLSSQLISSARKQTKKGLHGKMEGHAAMDMSVRKLKITEALNSISQYFVMEIAAIWIDVLLGFLIAGSLTVLVPNTFWQAFFLTQDPKIATIEGPLVGPLVAVVSFVCSVGNIPLAAVLWQGGISFGGVISFIFADLIILPILDIYRKYYGWKVMLYISSIFYCVMAFTGYATEFLFGLFHIVPTNRNIALFTDHITWDYTTWLNIIFLFFAAILLYRFIKNGDIPMLKMMD